MKNIKYLVFDEADKLLNMDFEKEINQILDIINKDRNTFLFSATMTNKVIIPLFIIHSGQQTPKG